MQIEIFEATTPAQRLDLESEATALLEFMTPDATTRQIEIIEPAGALSPEP